MFQKSDSRDLKKNMFLRFLTLFFTVFELDNVAWWDRPTDFYYMYPFFAVLTIFFTVFEHDIVARLDRTTDFYIYLEKN